VHSLPVLATSSTSLYTLVCCVKRHHVTRRAIPARPWPAEVRRESGADVVVRRLDLTDAASIAEVQEFIAREYGRLDCLVNNAAVCFNDPTLYGKVPHTPFRAQAGLTIDTNFFGTLAVTRAMLPLLRASPSPRVVNVASAAGQGA